MDLLKPIPEIFLRESLTFPCIRFLFFLPVSFPGRFQLSDWFTPHIYARLQIFFFLSTRFNRFLKRHLPVHKVYSVAWPYYTWTIFLETNYGRGSQNVIFFEHTRRVLAQKHSQIQLGVGKYDYEFSYWNQILGYFFWSGDKNGEYIAPMDAIWLRSCVSRPLCQEQKLKMNGGLGSSANQASK